MEHKSALYDVEDKMAVDWSLRWELESGDAWGNFTGGDSKLTLDALIVVVVECCTINFERNPPFTISSPL